MFPERLKYLRECKELSQLYMSQLLFLTPSSYNSYEKGKSKPPMDTLIKLARFFDVSIDYLVGLTDIPDPGFVGLSDDAQILLDTFSNINPALQESLMEYSDFLIMQEARSRLLESSSDPAPKKRATGSDTIRNLDEYAMYLKIKTNINKKP